MDRHGKHGSHGRLLGGKMQDTRGAAPNHIPGRDPAPSVYGLAAPSCQAICILTDADCHSSELVRTSTVCCLRLLPRM